MNNKQRKQTKKQEQKYLHQKLMYMLPPDVEIGKMFSLKFFDENYYKPRTLKAFIFAFGWLEANRDILPQGQIRFHGTHFNVKKDNTEILCVNFAGCKLKDIYVFDKEACSEIISVCEPTEKFDSIYEWVGR